MLARCVRSAGVRQALSHRAGPRRAFSEGGSGRPPLVSSDRVRAWMDDEQLVDPNLGMWSSFEMWMMMRQLRGFELPEFLDGCRHAYPAVCGLMYTREWDALEPMVSPKCLEAMQAMMEEFGSAARRIQVEDVEEDFQVQSALLTKVMLIDDDETDGPNCHLDVKFLVHESYKIFDFHTNSVIEPFDGRKRPQESTWRFEGRVSEDDGDAGWKLFALV